MVPHKAATGGRALHDAANVGPTLRDGPCRVTQCRGHIGLLALMLVSLLAAPASAHKLTVSASAEGATIRGKASFHGGIPARGLEVTALDPKLIEIGRTTTDEQGEFTLEAQYRCDYRLLVATPDGHGSEFLLEAAQLPADLPPRGGEPATAASHDHHHPHGPAPAAGDIAGLRAEIAALREQLTGYENRTRLRDVLGGIGYILGLAGLAFYFLGVKRKGVADPTAK